ncbi:prolipoprotein diacylglyceryl transferase [bacterium]
MYPVLISFGHLKIYSYGLCVAFGLLIGWYIAVKEAKRNDIAESTINDLFFIIVLSSILGGRLFYIFLNLKHYTINPLLILKVWEGGLVFFGGLITTVIVSIIYLKKKNFKVFLIGDICAPGIAIGHAIGRIGCFFAGCCYGKQTNSIFGVVFNNSYSLAPQGIKLHPAQLYEFLVLVAIFLALWFMRRKTKFYGHLFWMYICMYSFSRIILEFFRADHRGEFLFLSVTQFIAVLLLVIGVGNLYVGYRKAKTSS